MVSQVLKQHYETNFFNHFVGHIKMADQRAQLRQELKAAREALDKKEWKEALQHCKTALKLDSKNYNVFVFIGLAAAELGQEKQSEEAYRRATALQPATILAWQVVYIILFIIILFIIKTKNTNTKNHCG